MSDEVTPSRLLALPRELRDEIYEYALSDTLYVGTRDKKICARKAGLLATSKQIRHEALKLYYQRTTLEISEASWFWGCCTTKFLASLPTGHRDFVANINVLLATYEEEYPYQRLWIAGVRPPESLFKRTEKKRLLLDNLKSAVRRNGFALKDGVLKTSVTAWNGERYEQVWITDSVGEVPPRF